MRSVPTLTICAYLAVAAVPAAAQSNYFIKLDGMDPAGRAADDRKGHIEISSWQWGSTQAGDGTVDALTDGVLIVRNNAAPSRDMTMKGSKIGQNSSSAGKYGAVSGIRRADDLAGSSRTSVGSSRTETIGGGRTETSGKQNKLQELRAKSVADIAETDGGTAPYNPKEISVAKTVPWKSEPRPLDRGAVRVKVKFPWVGCTVGTRYPALALGAGADVYELQDAVVTSCGSASSSGESWPTEEVSFNYAKVKVRGWDPEKKE